MLLENTSEESVIVVITYCQCISVDRCILETFRKHVNVFIDVFAKKKKKEKKKTAKCIYECHQTIKEYLSDFEIAVVCDSSKNYSFILQDKAQSYHWTNNQATVHPSMIYRISANTPHHRNPHTLSLGEEI